MKCLSIYNKNKIDLNKHRLFYSTEQNKINNGSIRFTELTSIRHFPPAVREWNNSIYNFNKNNSSYSVIKYNQLNLLMKNYFSLDDNIELARSKRMRYLRRKYKSRKFYISKPEIKQSNDKISITVYCLDRDKQILTKRLFFYNKPKFSQKIIDLWKKPKKKIKKSRGGKIYIKFIKNKRFGKDLSKKLNISFSGIKHIKNLRVFRKKNLIKNRLIEQSISFQLYKYILSIFGIQIYIPMFSPIKIKNDENVYAFSMLRLKRENKRMLLNIIKSNPNALYWINYNTGVIDRIEKKYINYDFLIKKLSQQREIINPMALNKFKLEINNKLSFIVNKYIVSNRITDLTLLKILNNLSFKLSKFSKQNLYKERTTEISKLINLFQHSLLKFKRLLPVLKKLIDNIYNKKIELNLVNLKYFYLNSDIFAQVLIPKIKKRISAIKVTRKSLKKIKPTANLLETEKIDTFNNIPFLSLNNNLSLNSLYKNISPVNTIENEDSSLNTIENEDSLLNTIEDEDSLLNTIEDEEQNEESLLNTVFNELYPKNHLYNYDNTIEEPKYNKYYKTKNILNTIKYKSLLGVWVQIKGRLTRRNTAARSIKFKTYKGGLKDKNKYIYLNQNNNISTIILRNDVRSNTQYTYKGSFRRIGSFGIKTWISSR